MILERFNGVSLLRMAQVLHQCIFKPVKTLFLSSTVWLSYLGSIEFIVNVDVKREW